MGGGGAAGKPESNSGSSGLSESGGREAESGAAGASEEGGDAGTSAGGTAGNPAGGTAGAEVTAGSGGTGAAAGSPSAGSAGTAAAAGAAGAPQATGCAKLSVPLDDQNDNAHFVVTLPATIDLRSGTVYMRVFVAAGTGGTLFNYVQDPSFHYTAVATANRTSIASLYGVWTTLSWDIGAQTTDLGTVDKSMVKRFGIEVNAAPATAAGSWTSPTIIYVDSLAVGNGTVSYALPLDTSSNVISAGTTNDPSPLPAVPPLWFNNGSTDTHAANVTLTWQATCP